jgi:uncharacterized RDD family membrane protein YckC
VQAPLDTDVAIETPEHIVFRHRVAGPARRLAAYALDLVICYGALAVVGALVFLASLGAGAMIHSAKEGLGTAVGLVLVLLFAVQWVYFAVLEGWRGTTPGKAALSLRLVTTSGRPIGFRAAALRNLLRAADALPLTYSAGLVSIAGLASMSATRRFQRLGDLVAGTLVIVAARAEATTALVLSPPARPDELARLPEEVQLDADERHAIELFLQRRASLGRARELELAAMIAPLIGARYSGLSSANPSRVLALLYDRATSTGRGDSLPPSLPPPSGSWR